MRINNGGRQSKDGGLRVSYTYHNLFENKIFTQLGGVVIILLSMIKGKLWRGPYNSTKHDWRKIVYGQQTTCLKINDHVRTNNGGRQSKDGGLRVSYT